MASIKLSALNQATAYTLNDIVAIVDSGSTETKKINVKDLFRNTDNITESQTNTNAVSIANDGSSGFQVLRGSNTTSAVIASYGSYIDGGQNHFIGGTNNSSIQTGAAGHSGIVGCDTCDITGGYNHFIGGSYNGPQITGGEENVILASVGGTQVSGNNNAAIASQGFVIQNSIKTCGAGVEAGGWNGPRYSFAGGGYNLTTTNDGGNDHAALAYNGLTFDGTDNGNYLYKVAGIAVQSSTIKHDISVMMAASGRTTQYSATTHTDNLYSFGQISNGYYDNGTGSTFTIDFDEGNNQEFYMNGNTTLTFDNVRNGATYKLKVVNGGTHTISSVSATGFDILCEGGSIPNITNNGVDLCILEVFDTDIMVRHFADFSTP